ncbi:MAG: NAD(P)-dependent oxidoreductase [Brevinema sp.]
MSKVLAFGVRDDEREPLAYWAKEYGLQVDIIEEDLGNENLDLVKGYSYVSTLNTEKLDRGALSALKQHGLKVLSLRIAGLDNVDLPAAKDLGLAVSHVPSYSPHAISEFTVLTALALLRNYRLTLNRTPLYDFRISDIIGREIRNLTVGVIGAGRIGSLTVKHFAGFGAKKILINDILPKEELRQYGEYCDKEKIYAEADIISYHVPLKKDTYHLINADTISQMKKGVIILNHARGGIFDGQALLDGLDNGHIDGAALDVYEHETGYFYKDWSAKPLPDPILKGLVAHPRCYISAHVAFYTDEAVSNMVSVSLNNIRSFIDEGTCPNHAAW